MKITNPTGRLGEDKACEYLKKLGYKILERNYRKSYGEIDIIAIETLKDQKTLCFIEVKTRTSNVFGTPLESISPWKLKSLMRTAEYYKISHRNLPEAMRIDAISVILDDNRLQSIEFLKNISGF